MGVPPELMVQGRDTARPLCRDPFGGYISTPAGKGFIQFPLFLRPPGPGKIHGHRRAAPWALGPWGA
jgi:hypothetical protein